MGKRRRDLGWGRLLGIIKQDIFKKMRMNKMENYTDDKKLGGKQKIR